MSLDLKIKEWETESQPVFERLKKLLGQGKFRSHPGQGNGKCYDRESFEFKYQKCERCKYLYSNMSGKTKITIPKGKRRGRTIQIIQEQGENIYENRNDIKELNIEIGKKIQKFYRDEFYSISNINWYVTSSQLTNISLVMLILKLYSIRKNFPIYLDFLNFYNCTETNFLIYVEQDYEDIDSFNRDPNFNVSYSPLAQKRVVTNFSVGVIRDILFQIVIALKFYGSLFFTHNECDWSKLRFSNHAVHVQYSTEEGDSEFICSFKCYISPSVYSSISIYDSEKNWWGRFLHTTGGMRLTTSEKIPYDDYIIEMNGTRNYYLHDPFKVSKCLPEEKREYYEKHRIYFYRFNTKMEYFIKLRRDKGSVFGLNSFDVVTLFCSLMTIPYFSEPLMDNDELFRIWLGLWRKDEGRMITEILTSQKKPLLFDDICRIIRKFYIRFDALPYLYHSLI